MTRAGAITRRELLVGAAIAASSAALIGGGAAGALLTRRGAAHQSGVASPFTPERHGLVAAADLPDPVLADRAALRDALGLLGAAGAAHGGTVLLGLGPRVVAAIDPRLPGAAALPPFASDRLDAARSGGDLLVGLYSADEATLDNAAILAAAGATERCGRSGSAGPARARWW